eukprot:CAMPEP_0206039682 /NCGR_PEP_ID=MMETSP1466-20131121/4918_1 /ASSEMBLY_ACC=CAM_ASM_001126 /TAXON_ID=44452 /ORGANISM="Pavlova gyrans, Strain CCMP608" /LENGTH=333 /DNA_ID=CAMNT_0053414333 /DNA_START=50 /DNA_END=1051 /DNA_ORIENTATION=+
MPTVCERLFRSPLEPATEDKPPPRFDVSDVDAWRRFLDMNGFVVIAGVADAPACDEAERLFWKWAVDADERVSPGDPETWQHIPCCPSNGIIFSHGIGQSAFAWHLRAQPAVRRAFAEVWGVDDAELISSFDGANVFRPFAEPVGNPAWLTSGGWWHVDQSGHKNGLRAVQGLVSVRAATPATGGLCVIPGSHRMHHTLADRYPHVHDDYVHLARDDPVLRAVCAGEMPPATLVQCEAGDLVLWDSRVVHCNTPALVRAPEQGMPRLLRLVTYVCMAPRAWADDETLAARRCAVDDFATSTHWPHQLKVTSKLSRRPGTSRYEQLTHEQKELV